MKRHLAPAAALLAAATVLAVPAATHAAPAADVTAAPVLPLAQQPDRAPSYGRASAPDQRLRPGCHDYRFQYRITAPGDGWMAELVLINPGGRRIANQTFVSGEHPRRASRTWTVCDTVTRPGRHTIELRVTNYDGREESEQVRTSAFRLTRR
ncbi:hypothetical protein [Nocardioides sp.]|uniref:hypothetical protein n=1 Tax=Nocardioides sp. TaxID=35761 RepID=UPI003519CE9B